MKKRAISKVKRKTLKTYSLNNKGFKSTGKGRNNNAKVY